MIPVIFELCFVAVLAFLLAGAEKEYDDLQHSKKVILSLNHTMQLSMTAYAALAASGSDVSMDRKLAELDNLDRELRSGKSFLGMNLDSVPELKELEEQDQFIRSGILKIVERIHHAIGDQTDSEKMRRFRFRLIRPEMRKAMAQVLFEMAPYSKQVLAVERRVRSTEPEEMKRIQSTLWFAVVAGLLVSVLISLILARLFVKDIVFRLRQVSDNARLIAVWKPLPNAQSGGDEIAEFDRVLHEASVTLNYAREKQMIILDNAANVLCTLDDRLKFVDVNATATRYWGYQQDELRGLSVLSLLRRDTVNDTNETLERISHGNHQGEVENVVRTKSKSFMNCLWTVNWLPQKRLFYCVVHDVTEIRAVEKLKQHILSIVGHDLRAPLTAVSLTLSLILKVKQAEVSESVLVEVEKSEKILARVMQLVNDLLELEKYGVGKIRLDRSCLSAKELCSDAISAVEALASQSSITINGPTDDAAVFGDSQRLIQVLINLLANAIKFSPSGSSIDLTILKRDRSLIELRVMDQGPGIPPDQLTLIFDKFHQLRSITPTRETKSTGLGLAIVKEIVTAHEGECGVESELGKGSTFWLRIPVFIDQLEVES